MRSLSRTRRLLRLGLPVALTLVLAAGCNASIGDSCQTATDCSQDGSRICDTQEPGGYCTIMTCTATSCPSEAECVAFYPAAFLTTPCNPATEGAPPGSSPPPTHDCLPGEICLSEGLCAPEGSERTFCEFRCGSTGDCRGGYVCRETGYDGAEPVANGAAPLTPEYFCAPAP